MIVEAIKLKYFGIFRYFIGVNRNTLDINIERGLPINIQMDPGIRHAL
jgi:hypothetical protein